MKKVFFMLVLAVVASVVYAMTAHGAESFKYSKLHTIGNFQYQYVHLGIPSAILVRQISILVGPEARLDFNAVPLHVIETSEGLALAAPARRYNEITRITSGVAFVSAFPNWDVQHDTRVDALTADKIQEKLDAFDIPAVYRMIKDAMAAKRGYRP